ncbi:hypothetical protein [uncultured Jannaschia sp.]|uniref:hypothetical protein n=1 Tax=uncultured Jannaschia sp. TaxID=293347 RepID=UPI0026225906|nr:hypothetical protein [uncultured Jannaschia sp.]
MRDAISEVKATIRTMLRDGFHAVPSARADSGKVHLEVWESRARRTVGLEMGHEETVNLWLVSLNVPPDLPGSINRTDKLPKGRGWTDAAGKGANSNLSAYETFRTKKITRLGITRKDDARYILEHLNR